LAAALLLALTGCSEGAKNVGDLRVTGEIRPEYEHRTAPIGGPAPGISRLAFADSLHGVAVADGGGNVGVGELQVTSDGGETWRTVYRKRSVSLVNIAIVGRNHIVVLGGAPPPKEPWNLEPLLFRSDDGGGTWRNFVPRMPKGPWPLSLRFVTPTLGFAFPAPGETNTRIWLLRTTDGGHTWRGVRKPRDAGPAVSSVDFVSSGLGYATSPRRCGAGLYRTDDGGATWHGVPGSCVHGIRAYSVDFVDARHAFMAGGALGRRVVLATSDAGRTWKEQSNDPTRLESWIRVEFERSGRVGWGQRGDCDPFDPPCTTLGGLWRTADGGSTWRRQRLGYVTDFDAHDASHAWATGSGTTASGIVWKTINGGGSWGRIVGSRGIAPDSVSFSGSSVVLSTVGGYLGSDDSGRSWRWLDLHFPRGSAPDSASLAPDLSSVPSHDGKWVWLSTNLGRSWGRVGLPVEDPTSLAFAGRLHGVVAANGTVGYTTSDGGRTWTRRKFPFDAAHEVQLDAAPGLIIENDGFDSRAFALSTDGGASWRLVRLPRGYQGVRAQPGRGRTVTVSADRRGHGYEAYVSFDGGKTWKRVRGQLPEIAQGGSEAWGVDGVDRRRVWHSTDGGRRWTQVWPRPPASR